MQLAYRLQPQRLEQSDALLLWQCDRHAGRLSSDRDQAVRASPIIVRAPSVNHLAVAWEKWELPRGKPSLMTSFGDVPLTGALYDKAFCELAR
jgi:hypothetical protein